MPVSQNSGMNILRQHLHFWKENYLNLHDIYTKRTYVTGIFDILNGV